MNDKPPLHPTAPSDFFLDMIIDTGSPVVKCELCDRIHFDRNGEFMDPGELARLIENESTQPDKYRSWDGQVHWGYLGSRSVVHGCPCNGVAMYEHFLWANRYLVAAYYDARTRRQHFQALTDNNIADKVREIVGPGGVMPEPAVNPPEEPKRLMRLQRGRLTASIRADGVYVDEYDNSGARCGSYRRECLTDTWQYLTQNEWHPCPAPKEVVDLGELLQAYHDLGTFPEEMQVNDTPPEPVDVTPEYAEFPTVELIVANPRQVGPEKPCGICGATDYANCFCDLSTFWCRTCNLEVMQHTLTRCPITRNLVHIVPHPEDPNHPGQACGPIAEEGLF